MSNMSQILGSNPLTRVMMQKGVPLSALAQVSPSSANFSPDMQVPPFPPMPNGSPMSAMGPMPPQPAPQPVQAPTMATAPRPLPLGGGTKPMPKSEEEQIVKALIERLAAKTDMAQGKRLL